MSNSGGTRVRIDPHELDAILVDMCGEIRHGVTTSILGTGLINDARLLIWPDGTRRILRIAPTDAFASSGPSWFTSWGLRREASVIAAASDLSAYLPATIACDFERRIIDRDWVIQETMRGVPLPTASSDLSLSVRRAIWREIGAFVNRLHQIRGHRFGAPAWGPGFDRWRDLIHHDLVGICADAQRYELPMQPFARLAATVEQYPGLFDRVTEPRLIHSDLAPAHIFIDRPGDRWQFSGVIDLEFGRFADPLSESLWADEAWADEPDEMRDAFQEGYGPLSPPTGDRHRRIAFYQALQLAWLAPLLAMQRQPTDGILGRLTAIVTRLDQELAGAS